MPWPAGTAAVAAVLAMLAAVAGCGLFRDGGPQSTAQAFLTAWTSGNDAAAAALTDDPPAAGEVLAAVRRSLTPAGLTARIGQVRSATDRAAVSVDVSWDLGSGRRWSYLDELDVRLAPQTEDGWLVHWTPAVVHPALGDRQRLVLGADPPEPAPVVDRTGAPLLAPATVVNVLLDRTAAGDLPAVAAALAAALGPIDPAITAQTIIDGAAAVPAGQAYSVAVLRDADYQGVRNAIYDLPGVRFTTSSRLLAPDAGFARQVLPALRTEVAPLVDGVPGWSVGIVDAAGNAVRTLVAAPPAPGRAVAVGLDRGMQAAAEDAVEALPQQTALVAVQPSTGDLLAVAQNGPADTAGPLALSGRFPPGSTFKIVTATAAVEEDRLTAGSPVPCPGTTTVGGRLVANEGRFDLGTVPLGLAFARSCNTTFAGLATALEPGALPGAALQLGLGSDYRVPGLTTVTGSVPAAADPVQRAENGFGQGQVVASPFGMALVAASVARGAPVVPQLIRGRQTEVLTAATAPDPAALAQLRPMMRQVVTEGTATALAGLGGVYGKTGTAEFTEDGSRSHGWFVGYRGDLALAVLVVDGGSSAPAVGVTQRFLAATG